MYVASSLRFQFHWYLSWDSGAFVKPFILANNYLAIDCATLSRSDLPRPFNCLSPNNLFITWVQIQPLGRPHLQYFRPLALLEAMFLVNSRHPLFSATRKVFDRALKSPAHFFLVPLLANLQGHFAEFLKINSTITLKPTCVSFSTVSQNIYFNVFDMYYLYPLG